MSSLEGLSTLLLDFERQPGGSEDWPKERGKRSLYLGAAQISPSPIHLVHHLGPRVAIISIFSILGVGVYYIITILCVLGSPIDVRFHENHPISVVQQECAACLLACLW
jgi:hypothetical protein